MIQKDVLGLQLLEFNAHSCPRAVGGNVNFPVINFTKKEGNIRFNAAAANFLKLKKGDSVSFFQDKRQLKDWYLRIDSANGYKLNSASPDKLQFNHRFLVAEIFKSQLFPENQNRAVCLISWEVIRHPDGNLFQLLSWSFNSNQISRRPQMLYDAVEM